MSEQRASRAVPNLGPDAYAHWRRSELGAITERLERELILELTGPVDDCDVLDLGCGDGDLAGELHARGARVVGLDASLAMIRRAKARLDGQRQCSLLVGAADHLPFPPTCFDVVVAVTLLCFVKDGACVFKEIARILRPGGRMIIGELGRWSSWSAERRIRGWLGSPLWRRGYFRSPRTLRRLAAQAGLTPGAVRGAIYYPRWTPVARLMAPWDAVLARVTNVGAAFLALSATKPLDRASGAIWRL